MFGQTQLIELQARKSLLLLQAEAHRSLLASDAQRVADSLHWIEPVYHTWQHIKPLAWIFAPLAGFAVARHGRSVWRWAVPALKLWRGLKWAKSALRM
jgi:hypothetical protein